MRHLHRVFVVIFLLACSIICFGKSNKLSIGGASSESACDNFKSHGTCIYFNKVADAFDWIEGDFCKKARKIKHAKIIIVVRAGDNFFKSRRTLSWPCISQYAGVSLDFISVGGRVVIRGDRLVPARELSVSKDVNSKLWLYTFPSVGPYESFDSYAIAGFPVSLKNNPQPLVAGLDLVISKVPRNGFYTLGDYYIDKDRVNFAEPALPPVFSKHGVVPILYGYLGRGWADFRAPLVNVDGLISFANNSKYGVAKGGRYFVINSPLLHYGEWFFDSKKSTYSFATSAQIKSSVSVTSVPTLLKLVDSVGVTFKGFSFVGSTSNAVIVEGSRDVHFSDGYIYDVGGVGIEFIRSKRSGVSRFLFKNIGLSCVYLDGGDSKTLGRGYLYVKYSKFSRCGVWSRVYNPAVIVKGVYNSVESNSISNLSHAAILFEGNDHLIASNNIHNVMREVADSGAIYTTRSWVSRGTHIEYNFIHNAKFSPVPNEQNFGVYLDDQASGIVVRYNLFSGLEGGVFVGGGSDNFIIGNVFHRAKNWLKADARGVTWQRNLSESYYGQLQVLLRKFVSTSYSPYLKYSGIKNSTPHSLSSALNNVISDNIALDSGYPILDQYFPNEAFGGGNLHMSSDFDPICTFLPRIKSPSIDDFKRISNCFPVNTALNPFQLFDVPVANEID